MRGSFFGGAAFLLLLLSSSLFLVGGEGRRQGRRKGGYEGEVNGRMDPEEEEWWSLLRLFELKQLEWEEELEKERRGEEREKREPDTPWLKTCAGWVAQELCSTIFGSGLSEEKAIREDLGHLPRIANDFWINYEEKSATSSCRFFNPQNMTYKAIWREGIGCTLVERLSEEEIRAQKLGDVQSPPPLDPNIPWPRGEGFFPENAPEGIDLQCVQELADEQFENQIYNTRAIVVIYKGELVFEQYGEGISKENPLLGWSATKSLTQSLIGISTKYGLDIFKAAPVPEWYVEEGDPRQNITVDMMLRMSSGTKWVGDIGPTTECIFWSDANCAYACGQKELVEEPDTFWNYNSGSSYLLSRMSLEYRDHSRFNNFEWPKKALFHPIGAHSMYIEYQANQLFLGGAYGYGTARDWARFGLLHLRNGIWVDGTRILPEGWSEYSRKTTHTNREYAAHFWKFPLLDRDMFFASGFRNQNVYIFPKQDLVVVRFAMPALAAHPVYQATRLRFLRGMLNCVSGSE